jgi:tartrate dehydratase alpha subunit/fumarate hydratase class I-like protein
LDTAKIVENVGFNILKQAVIYLPDDVKEALKKAYAEETSETGKTQLKAILDNVELAEKYKAPVCQDTGTIIFYVKAGAKAKDLDRVEGALINATRRATKEVPLRPNAVDPFTGAQPCPPNILGVAMGGGADISMKLAKKTLLKPLTEHNPDPEIAKLERDIFEAANMTGIGPMGLGGKTTVLGVHIDYAYRHPASFPAAVAFNCWASRRSAARISADGTVEYLTHKLKE